jgi:pimeloyl-ACP methyl ester carboxylesterase
MRSPRFVRAWARLPSLAALLLTSGCRERIRSFDYYAAPLAPEAYAALAARPGWTASTIDVEPGITLRGLVHPPAAEGAPWVLFFPGNGPGQLAQSQGYLDRLRGDRPWGMAVWSYRGFDGSGGAPGRDAILADAVKVLDQLCAREHVTRERVRLVGFSLGSHVAASTAARAARDGGRIASLTLLASPSVIDVKDERYDTLALLPDLAGPVLVIHGAADEALPVAQGRAVAAHLGDRVRWLELPRVGHEGILDAAPALDAVRGFVESP